MGLLGGDGGADGFPLSFGPLCEPRCQDGPAGRDRRHRGMTGVAPAAGAGLAQIAGGAQAMDAVAMVRTRGRGARAPVRRPDRRPGPRPAAVQALPRPRAGTPGARRQDRPALPRGAGTGGHGRGAAHAVRRPSGAAGRCRAGRADPRCVHRAGPKTRNTRDEKVVSRMLWTFPCGALRASEGPVFGRRGQGTPVRGAAKGFPSRRPCASGSGRRRAAPKAASAGSWRRAARSGS